MVLRKINILFIHVLTLVCLFNINHALGAQGVKLALPDTAYPNKAKYIPPGSDLQKALNRYRVVRLGAGVYPSTVTLSSKQKIYGLPGSRVNQIIVKSGTQQALLWKVDTNLTFAAGRKPARHNVFMGIGSISIINATLDGNLFLDSGGINIDLSKGGYLRNNRFIRTVLQGPRQLVFKGNVKTPSYNNVFLWFNPLSPKQAPMFLDQLQDVTFVGVDSELWLSKGKGAMFHTGKMGTLRIFGGQGGENTAPGNRDGHQYKPLPILKTGAEEVQLYGLTPHGPKVSPNLILEEGNKRVFTAWCKRYERRLPSSNELDLNVFEWGTEGTDRLRQRGVNAETLKSLLVPARRKGSPWERPSFPEIPDPSGEDWMKNLAEKKDHTEMLQKRIDSEGMAVLAPGVYYISEPLLIGEKSGIIGSGMDKTVIIAKTPGMSLIRADHRKSPTHFTLSNLTLQGGSVGLEVREKDIGTFISRSYISHVQFRDMSVAGIHVNMPQGVGVQSLDNNLITNCIFYRCASGVKQTASTKAPAGFMDKNIFYGCQFVECDSGLELIARRQNNLNACINTLFKHCRQNAVRLRNSATTTFANCDFIENGGDPVISSNFSIVLASCNFLAGNQGGSILPSSFMAEGCVFDASDSSTSKILDNGRTNHFFNCSATLPLGQVGNGMFTNNYFQKNKPFSKLAITVTDGEPTVLVDGPVDPSPQMLFGSHFGASRVKTGKKKPITKTIVRSARHRKPSTDVLQDYDTRLRLRLASALHKKGKVVFNWQKMRTSAIVKKVKTGGVLEVEIAFPSAVMNVPMHTLTYADRMSLGLALVDDNDSQSHALVAFYALCIDNAKLAAKHLSAAGSMADGVRDIFTAK